MTRPTGTGRDAAGYQAISKRAGQVHRTLSLTKNDSTYNWADIFSFPRNWKLQTDRLRFYLDTKCNFVMVYDFMQPISLVNFFDKSLKITQGLKLTEAFTDVYLSGDHVRRVLIQLFWLLPCNFSISAVPRSFEVMFRWT